jgi:hypothetical protein
MRRLWYSWLILTTLVGASAGASAAAKPAHVKASAQADAFFDPERTYDLHIRLTAQAWKLMQPDRRVRPAGLSNPRRCPRPAPPPPIPC